MFFQDGPCSRCPDFYAITASAITLITSDLLEGSCPSWDRANSRCHAVTQTSNSEQTIMSHSSNSFKIVEHNSVGSLKLEAFFKIPHNCLLN